MGNRRNNNLRWDKLDNTAQLFPVIAREGMSNVYRLSVVLKEEINPEALQKALDKVLPYFDVFNSMMKKGICCRVSGVPSAPTFPPPPEPGLSCLHLGLLWEWTVIFSITCVLKIRSGRF